MITLDEPYNQSFYARELRNGKYLVFSVYCNNEIIGACYVSNTHNSLYVEQLFVRKDLQRTGYSIGSKLLNYVLNNKKYIEDYFQNKYTVSYLSAHNSDLEKYYEKFGYKRIDDNYMKKSI